MSCTQEPSGVQFLTLNTEATWRRGQAEGIEISADGIALAQQLAYDRARTISLQELGGLTSITDFDIGPCGLLYVLGRDDQGPAVIAYDSTLGLTERLHGINHHLKDPTSIAIAGRWLYVADKSELGAIVAISRFESEHDSTMVLQMVPQQAINLSDLAGAESGVAFALDANTRKILRADAATRTVGPWAEAPPDSTPVALAWSEKVASLYVLDQTAKRVLTVRKQGEPPLTMELPQDDALPAGFMPSGFAVDEEGDIYIGDGREQPAMPGEDDRFVHRFRVSGSKLDYLTPIGGFRGPAKKIAFDRASRMMHLLTASPATGDQIIVLEATVQKPERSSVAHGQYTSAAFDSGVEGAEWHALVLEAEIPLNTQLSVAHHTSDADIGAPSHDCAEKMNGWSKPIVFSPQAPEEPGQTQELTALIQSDKTGGARGRYLWLMFCLTGSEVATPKVKKARVYFPRTSYLRYLPGVYQSDEQSSDFLERFLSLFETLFAGIERKADQATRLLDAEATPDDFLDWLGSWLAIARDERWEPQQMRDLIKQAPSLYRQRGTRDGIETLVRLFTGAEPLIVEPFDIPPANDDDFKAILKQLYPSYPDPYSFYVFLRPGQAGQVKEQEAVIRRLIEAERPAHTFAYIRSLESCITLGGHTYIGVNTILAAPARLGTGAALNNARLTPPANL